MSATTKTAADAVLAAASGAGTPTMVASGELFMKLGALAKRLGWYDDPGNPKLGEFLCRHLDALAAAPAAAPVVEVTDAMVAAYLQANTAYWQRADEQPTKLGKWRNGTPSEATRESLRAVFELLAAGATGEQA